MTPRRRTSRAAFTLIELLVAVSIIAILLAVLMPGLGRARRQAGAAVCASNLRQIIMANAMYAENNNGRYCPGAADMRGGNRHRWHGTRSNGNGPFDAARGPLTPYLTSDGRIRSCPSFGQYARRFEAGNGGYGYNNAFIGTELVETGPGLYVLRSDRTGVQVDRVRRPAETLMFVDSAFVSNHELIEYSFAEPRFHPTFGTRADPSIHFRHARRANVGWCDGHVDAHRRTFTWSSGLYLGDPARFDIGWSGQTDDNSLFDLR